MLPCRVGRLWLFVALWMSFVGIVALGQQRYPAGYYSNAFSGSPANWVDTRVPRGATVEVVWDQRFSHGKPDFFYFWLVVTEFFNPSVGGFYSIGGPTYYDTFLPSVTARLTGTGAIVDEQGRALRSRYVLVTCRAPVKGRVVARTSDGALRLIEVDGPVRLAERPFCTPPRP